MGCRQPSRASTCDGYLLAQLLHPGHVEFVYIDLVGNEPLNGTDGYWLINVAAAACVLAGMIANTAQDGWKSVGSPHQLIAFEEFPIGAQRKIAWNIHMNGASYHTGWDPYGVRRTQAQAYEATDAFLNIHLGSEGHR